MARRTSSPSWRVRSDNRSLKHSRADSLVHRMIIRQENAQRKPFGEAGIRCEIGAVSSTASG